MPARLSPTWLLLLLACTACAARTVAQQEPPPSPVQPTGRADELTLPRHPALSPDGTRLAFSHQGDIWVAAVADGRATRLTAHDAYDARPFFSPDGAKIAFLSERHGNYDLFVMPAEGGKAERLTFHSESETLHGWTGESRLLIGAARDRRYARRAPGAWTVGLDGATPAVLGDWPAGRPALSADGRLLAYERGWGEPNRRAYRGSANSDLWVCDLTRGEHRALTDFDGNDLDPMYSADGSTLWFLSDRPCAGNASGRDLGLWQVPARGGAARLVHHPGGRSLRNPNVSADGRLVVAELDAGLVLIETATGAVRGLPVFGPYDPSQPAEMDVALTQGAAQIAVSPDGESIAFVAQGDLFVLRKHEEIRRCARVTAHPAAESNPVWVEDGKALLYVSERDGNAEVYRARPAKSDEPFYKSVAFVEERLTQTPEDESALLLSPDGKSLTWVVGLGRLVVGDPATLLARRTITDGFEAPDADWSPDSRWLAYAQADDDFNYEIWLAAADLEGMDPAAPGAVPFNLTRHPDNDLAPRWSPDGRRIAFTSRRLLLDETDVWLAWLRTEDVDRNARERLEAAEAAEKAKEKAEKDKAKDAKAAAPAHPLAGIWKGGEVTLTLAAGADGVLSGKIESPLHQGPLQDLAWDADKKELRCAVGAAEGEARVEVVLTLGEDGRLRGEARRGEQNWPLDLERQAPDEEKKEVKAEPVVMDWDGIGQRVRRLTRREGNETALGWDADSDLVYFNASVGTQLAEDSAGEAGFFSVQIHEGKEERLEGEAVGSFTRREKEMFYAMGGKIFGRDAKAVPYPFEARTRQDRRALREQVMLQAWRALDRNFYDAGFHGHDWAASLEKWRPIALAASTREDFDEMVNWMLGEMNSSHMGYSGAGPGPTDPAETDATRSGELGVLWDESFPGPGRRVAEVLPESPAARAISRLAPGDVVLAVNDDEVAAVVNWDRLMGGTVDRDTLLRVLGPDGAEREVAIRPAASSAESLYERFRRRCRARVEEASGGRLGYVHVEAMGTGSLVEFERALADAGIGRDGLIIDVRENGGGWTTDMMLAMLMPRDHAITVPRGGGDGYPQDRLIFARWDKPVVVLCNENSYSNAEIFSWSIRTLKRGPVVGKRTYGAVISTGGAGLLDGSFVRVPFRGWYVNDGTRTNMEGNGCPPDHPVEVLPQDHAAGLDRQLEKAIEVGLAGL